MKVEGMKVLRLGLEFGNFFSKNVTIQGFVLLLLFELSFIRSTSGRVRQCCLGGSGCLTELLLTGQLGFRERFGTWVTDLRGELATVHLFEDNVGVLADLSAEGSERGF